MPRLRPAASSSSSKQKSKRNSPLPKEAYATSANKGFVHAQAALWLPSGASFSWPSQLLSSSGLGSVGAAASSACRLGTEGETSGPAAERQIMSSFGTGFAPRGPSSTPPITQPAARAAAGATPNSEGSLETTALCQVKVLRPRRRISCSYKCDRKRTKLHASHPRKPSTEEFSKPGGAITDGRRR